MTKLDVLSDPICPWCFIGKRNLDAALAERPGHRLEIEYHPFQLNPGMPREGMDRRAYLEAKFGGREKAAAIYARINEAAEEAGLAIDWSKIARTPNTLDAHRLIHWAGIEGVQPAVVDALFAAYFLEGRDIGETEVLADIATACGLDRAMVAHLLAGDADCNLIAARDAMARERGVQGVPCYILANRWVVSGAQSPEAWVRIIDELDSLPADA